jgi:very-short-patch-repair endonuclease
MHREERRAFRRDLRNNATTCERRLWAKLRRRQISGYKFRRQHPIGPYVLDFFCLQRRLAIEVDGDSHYFTRGMLGDRWRTAYLAERGIRVIRFTNTEIIAELDDVLEAIARALRAAPLQLQAA